MPWTTIPRRASSWAWRPGPHPTSSTRAPGASPSARDDVVDLLHRPLRERVPQVRRPEVLGDRLEPVRCSSLDDSSPASLRRALRPPSAASMAGQAERRPGAERRQPQRGT